MTPEARLQVMGAFSPRFITLFRNRPRIAINSAVPNAGMAASIICCARRLNPNRRPATRSRNRSDSSCSHHPTRAWRTNGGRICQCRERDDSRLATAGYSHAPQQAVRFSKIPDRTARLQAHNTHRGSTHLLILVQRRRDLSWRDLVADLQFVPKPYMLVPKIAREGLTPLLCRIAGIHCRMT